MWISKTSMHALVVLVLFAVVWPLQFSAQSIEATGRQAHVLHSEVIANDSITEKIERIIRTGKELLGKPYRHRTSGGKVMDCSGFVSLIYGKHGIELPHSSSDIARVTRPVQYDDIRIGDLMFFKGRDAKGSRVGHVVMVISFSEGEIEIMHSCHRGILTETYNKSRYYLDRFLFAGRPAELDVAYPTPINNEQQSDLSGEILPDPLPVDSVRITRIIGVGDIMLGTNYPNTGYLPPNDGKDLLAPVHHILQSGDITFGNLEGTFLTGAGTVKKCSNPEVCYAFKMPDHYVNHLVTAGFNLLSLANNHINDFGAAGANNTVEVLKKAGIHHAGLLSCPYITFEKNNLTFGFAAFSPNTGTKSINDYETAKKIISHLDTICDVVIVSFHGGGEGPTRKHITRQTEIFLEENRGNPYEFARVVIDAGADVVFGHGPHVTRAVDLYKDRFITYSMGNFATYARFNLSGPNGIAPIMEIEVDEKGKFIQGKIHSIQQTGEGGPYPDEEARALNEIIELTREDIPECILDIRPDGTVVIRSE